MITSPDYSFIRFNAAAPDACCDDINSLLLPVINADDLRFQVISSGGAPGILEVLRGSDGTGEVVSTQSGFVLVSGNVYKWQSDINIDALACGECFQLRIDGSNLSNVFVKTCDPCFTSLLQYLNDTDYAGFIYCNADFFNSVRLFITLKNAKMNEDRTVYRQSQGTYKLTKSVITKEFQAVTEFMPVEFHDALMVALAHESISIHTSNYQGNITLSGAYNVAWEDGLCVAPGDFKAEITPLVIRNNNCQVCVAVIPPDCVPVGMVGELPPGGITGSLYNETLTLTGDGPFTLTIITKPAWMGITLVGNTLTFAGIITTEETPTNIHVTNCGGVSIADYDITACVELVLSSDAMPNGTVGTPYSFDVVVIGGTLPFTITGFSGPSWMTAAITSENTVTLSGTPDVTAGDALISLQITNCYDEVDFSGGIAIGS